jgi:hypothetical protein
VDGVAGDCRKLTVVGAMTDRLYILAMIAMTRALMLGLLWLTQALN